MTLLVLSHALSIGFIVPSLPCRLSHSPRVNHYMSRMNEHDAQSRKAIQNRKNAVGSSKTEKVQMDKENSNLS